MKLMTRYLNAKIYINDLDGNAIGIVVLASEVLRISGVTNDEVEIFQQEALSGSYENVLSTTVNWVDTSRKRGQPCVNPALARQFKSAVDKVVLLQNSTSASIIPELVR